MPPSVNMGHTY